MSVLDTGPQSISIAEPAFHIPDTWTWVSLGDIVTFQGGGTPSKDNPAYWGGAIPWASVKDIKGKYLESTLNQITEVGLKESAATMALPGDIILATRITPGKCIISKIETAINQDLKIVRPKIAVNPLYVWYFFTTFQEKLVTMSSGTTVKGLRLEHLNSFPFPLPPIDEQNRIAERLESLLGKIHQAHELIEHSQRLVYARRQAVLDLAFTGKLTERLSNSPSVEEQNKLNLPEVDGSYHLPVGWKWTKLSAVCEMQNGLSKRRGEDGTPTVVLRLADIEKTKVVVDNFREINLTEKEVEKYAVKNGDLLIVRVNGSIGLVGNAIYYDFPFTVAFCDHLIKLTVDPQVNPKYLWYLINADVVQGQLVNRIVSSAGQHTISQGNLAELRIPIPERYEQDELVFLLDNISDKEELIFKNTDLEISLRQVTQSLLMQAFQGSL